MERLHIQNRAHVLAMVLAGGEGRHCPSDAMRAKPAVPFGGHYRLIDFVLSNLANARFMRHRRAHPIQESQPGQAHRAEAGGCRPILGDMSRQSRRRCGLARAGSPGSADAIYQNLNIVDDENPDYVLVFGADHVYRMDPGAMLREHILSGAGVTVAGIRVPIAQASDFGIIEADADGRIRAFREKPKTQNPYRTTRTSPMRRWGTTYSPQTCCGWRRQGALRTRSRNTTSGATSSPCWLIKELPGSTTLRRTKSPARTNANTATGAMSGRLTPITTLTWT